MNKSSTANTMMSHFLYINVIKYIIKCRNEHIYIYIYIHYNIRVKRNEILSAYLQNSYLTLNAMPFHFKDVPSRVL